MPGTCPGWGDFQSAVGELGGSISGGSAGGGGGAAGGRSGGAWSHGTGAGMYQDSNGRWRDPSANPNGTTIYGKPTVDPLYNPTSGRHYDPTDEVGDYDAEVR